ncbi:MAG: NYN domain-containing protein [Candidatus Gracilibacteria bacterium]|nr:NYN domain-containing protein [Candidatus Gracilibacteria bacterium]
MFNKLQEKNIAFIDGQNLHLGTSSENWKIDFKRFRMYLEKKYNIEKAYYFLGFLDENQQEMYRKIQESGFIIEFREHTSHMKGKKKGNVDVDIVFEIMKRLIDKKDFNKIVLISGDGDYIKLVNYLILNNLLKKIVFPNKRFSSLYNPIAYNYGINLSLPDIKKKIEYIKKEVPLGN